MPNTGMDTPDISEGIKDSGGLKRTLGIIYRLEDIFLVVMFSAMLGMAIFQIILRVAFSSGVSWGDVMVRILVLWICLSGAMIATRQDKHINIDILTRYLPDHVRAIAGGLVRILAAMVCAIMAWQGVQLVRLDFDYETLAFAAVPAWGCEIIIPIGFTVMAFRYLILSLHFFRRTPKRQH